MTVERIYRYTCDSCGTISESNHRWVGVAVNVQAPDAAWEHNGWLRLHICPQCAPGLVYSAPVGRSINGPVSEFRLCNLQPSGNGCVTS